MIKCVAQHEFIPYAETGYAASMIVAHQRSAAKAIERQFAGQPGQHIGCVDSPFVPLVIEAWDSPIPGESRRISVAHCLEQGGDLVPDPILRSK